MLEHQPKVKKFKKVFEPGYIGKLQIKNRIIKAPICMHLADKGGCVNKRTINFYREIASGGAGLVIVEIVYIDDIASKAVLGELGISSPEHQPGLEWLALTIKENGPIQSDQRNI